MCSLRAQSRTVRWTIARRWAFAARRSAAAPFLVAPKSMLAEPAL
jgi:hypothetical protein